MPHPHTTNFFQVGGAIGFFQDLTGLAQADLLGLRAIFG